MSSLDSYFPWIRRVWFILCWFGEIVQDQVAPTYGAMFVPPSLWPGWGWAQMNAVYSSRAAPWHFSWILNDEPMSFYNDEDDDDYNDNEDF